MSALACAPSKFSVSDLSVSPPSLMVSKRSNRTLYVILDPTRVPTEITVLVNGKDQGGKLTDVQEFVKRDLKKAFSTYFNDVQVVPAGTPLGSKPHVIADVKIERVEVTSVGPNTGVAALTWGLGLRPSENNDYLYAVSGQSTGVPTFEPALLFSSMFESAIVNMLHGYTDKKVDEEIMNLP